MIGGAKGIGIGIDFGLPNLYRKPSGKSYIEPDVLASLRVVTMAYGKKNSDSDRAIIKNLVDPDNPFIISNAAYKLNSGFGLYQLDFDSLDRTDQSELTTDYKSVTISKIIKESDGNVIYNWSKNLPALDSVRIQVKGLDEIGARLVFIYLNDSGQNVRTTYHSDGIYTLPSSSAHAGNSYTTNFRLAIFGYTGDCNVTITQIPQYEGAFVTDGIDDLITSTKTVQEMLGGSTEFTAVSMIHLTSVGQSVDGNAYTNYIRTSDNYWVSNRVSNTDKTGIYGYSFKQGTPTVINNILGDKNDYTAEKSDDVSEIFRAKFSVEGFEHITSGAVHVSSVAWYWTVIANKVLTTDQINQVIAYYNLDRCVEPTVWYDVQKQGLSNETPAADWYLKDFSKNGFDMSLFNFAKKGGSGVSAKQFETLNDWILDTKDIEFVKNSEFSYTISAQKLNYWRIRVQNSVYNNSKTIKLVVDKECDWFGDLHYKLEGDTSDRIKTIKTTLQPNVATEVPVYCYSDFDEIEGATYVSCSSYIRALDDNVEITVTIIPSCKGAIILDGINDFGKVTGLPIYKDYTVAIDYQRLSIGYIETIGTTSLVSKSIKAGEGAFLMNLIGSTGAHMNTYSFGEVTVNIFNDLDRQIYYQSKYESQGFGITVGTGKDSDTLWLGTVRDKDARFFNGAIYRLLMFPYSMNKFLIERQLKKRKAGTLYPDMVEFRPIVKSNVEYQVVDFYIDTLPAVVGNYYPINSKLRIAITIKGAVDEVTSLKVNGVDFGTPSINNNRFTFNGTLSDKSPQKIDITIDEYIRYEDIVQPYPVLLRLKDESGNEVSWGGKFRIGSTVTRIGSIADAENNLLNGLYSVSGLSLNGKAVTTNTSVVEKQMVFKTTATYLLDSNAPKCILSPSRLRIPNSSYKILGYIPDLSGNGNHGKINNSAYAGMSGANGYNENFTTWSKYPKVNVTDSRITLNATTYNEYWIIYQKAPHKSFKVNISGIPTGGNLVYRNNQGNEVILSNGINTIPSVENAEYSVGFAIQANSASHNWSNLVIQQIGEYEGAYCLDGVDDSIHINTTGGKMMIMKTVVISPQNRILYDQRDVSSEGILSNQFAILTSNNSSLLAYSGRALGETYIDGILNKNIMCSDLINIKHNITFTMTGSYPIGTKAGVRLGASNLPASYCKASIYDFMLFDEISTGEEILNLNKYIGIEPKVTVPPYYWDAYGKANNNADDIEGTRHALWNKANLTDAGEALICNNIGYDEMSGYGGYSFNSFDTASRWNIYPNSGQVAAIEIISRNGYSITLKKKLEDIYSWQFNNGSTVTNLSEDLKFNVKCDKPIKVIWQFKYRLVAGEAYRTETISTDDLTANVEANLTLLHKTPAQLEEMGVIQHYYLIYFNNAKLAIDEEYTITMLPLYPNGCCLDGIDDYLINANIPALTNFTVIAKREWINKDTPLYECFAHKGNLNTPIRETAFMLEYEIMNDTYYRSSSYGGYINVERSNRPEKIVYQTPTSYNGTSITRGSGTDTTGLTIGAVTNNYWKGVFYKMMLYPKTLTNLEIMFLKNLFERDEIIDLTNPIFIQK